ncbi:hypothetical protein ACFE04_013680 [Oxalis oulophora]
MDQKATTKAADALKKGVEVVKSVSDKHVDLLRPSARYYSASKGWNIIFIRKNIASKLADTVQSHFVPSPRIIKLEVCSNCMVTDGGDREKGKYSLIRDPEDFQVGIYDKPLPCFGCGIGWFS